MLEKKDLVLKNSLYTKHVTIYTDTNSRPCACILYFHGGGLLYGNRNDLPKPHIETLIREGFAVAAFDYPLAPGARLDVITHDVCDSIRHYCENSSIYADSGLPYFLWGRSAGAYLCLIAAAFGEFPKAPKGILSYYGYGFLCDHWFNTPSSYYLTLPPVDASCLKSIPRDVHASGDLNTHYSVYVYARQTGKWFDLLYEGREKYFYLNHTLRTCSALPCPLFLAHATGDTDVPYEEFLELSGRFKSQRFIAPGTVHDFDRNTGHTDCKNLLKETLGFLKRHM